MTDSCFPLRVSACLTYLPGPVLGWRSLPSEERGGSSSGANPSIRLSTLHDGLTVYNRLGELPIMKRGLSVEARPF